MALDAAKWRGRIAFREVALTPDWPIHLAASGDVDSLVSEVADTITATCLLVESEGVTIVLVSVDLLYAGAGLTQSLSSAIDVVSGVDAGAVFATHTHFAPATDGSKPLLGAADTRYVRTISRQLEEAVAELASGPRHDVYLTVTASSCELGVNRRRKWPIVVSRSGVRLFPAVSGANFSGPKDEILTVAAFRSTDDDQPVAVVWNFACHPVGRFRSNQISAHFIGTVREQLRVLTDSMDLPVLFLQGFSGDVRPNHRDTNSPSKSGLTRARLGPGYSTFTAAGYEEWTQQMARQVATTFALPPRPATGSGVGVLTCELPRKLFLEGSLSDQPVTFKSFTFGKDLTIVGTSMEAVTAYAQFVRSRMPDRWVMPAGCMDDVAGYAPTERMVKEGGYEAHDFCRSFSATAVPASVEAAMLKGLKAVIPH